MHPGLPCAPAEYRVRIARLEAALARAGLDALIAFANRCHPGAVAYLAGYEPCLGLHDAAYALIAPTARLPYVLLTNAFWDEPARRTWMRDTLITADFGDELGGLLPPQAHRVGIAGYCSLPVPVYLALQIAHPAVEFLDSTSLLWDVAKIKGAAEIDLLRQCTHMTDAGVRTFLDGVRAGATERELRAGVEQAILLAGADGLSYATQIYSGPQVAVGIGFDENRVLRPGDQAQVDCGALLRGYRSDVSRVTSAGRPSSVAREFMEATAEMYEAMLRALRPGWPISGVAEAGLAAARRYGLEDYVYRSPNHQQQAVGHGIGCWPSELPEIYPGAPGLLQEGMVVVLEPILVRDGAAGAKIEDPVLITARDPERLSELPVRSW